MSLTRRRTATEGHSVAPPLPPSVQPSSPSLPLVPVLLLLPSLPFLPSLLSHVCSFLTSYPLFCLWFFTAAVLYPTYLYTLLLPHPPSTPRTLLTLLPLLFLSLLALPLPPLERWSFELAHLVVGAVVFSFKKAPELCVGRVEPSVTRSLPRFLLHFLVPASVVYLDPLPFPPPLDPHLASLPPKPFDALFRHTRRRALTNALRGAAHLTCAGLLGALTLALTYRTHPALPYLSDPLGALLILEVCSACFPLLRCLALLLHGDGLCVGPMFEGVWLATSISAFWRAWNRGMRDAFFHTLYLPLARRVGWVGGVVGVGLVSGALHEFEVRLWRRGSTGAMLTFFLLQAAAVGVHRAWRGWGGVRLPAVGGWLLTAVWLGWSSRYFLCDFGLTLEEMAGKAVYPLMVSAGWSWDDVQAALRPAAVDEEALVSK